MFSQRKRFYERKSFYGIILALLLAFGFWINQDTEAQQGEGEIKEPVVSTGEQVSSADKQGGRAPKASDYDRNDDKASGYDPYSDPSEERDSPVYGDENEDEDNTTEAPIGPCYLVKEDGGYIKIYSVDEKGDQELQRTTDISFSLLSESDQTLFKQGIVKETQDELMDLLQDFES